jgi:tRNA(Ile)-lysidine synthetase-like protein
MVETRRLTALASDAAGRLELPDTALVVALSGGADSAALAYLTVHADRPLRAIHIDHGLPGSLGLQRAASDIAALLGLELRVLTVAVGDGPSPEDQARDVRYRAMLADLEAGETVMTAHTRDDQAETVLMNLIRGAGPDGLAGIPRERGRVARPMLDISRSETREIATLAGLPYRDDPSNEDRAIRRNELRLDVLPDLAGRFNIRLVESLARAAELAEADAATLDREADSIPIIRDDRSAAVPVGSLISAPRPVADRVLRRMINEVRPPYGGNYSEIADLWEVAHRARSGLVLAGGLKAKVEGPMLILRAGESVVPVAMTRELEIGLNRLGRFGLAVTRGTDRCRVAPVGTRWALFDPDVALIGRLDERGDLSVDADGELAWAPGDRRYDVAWYQPGTSGYLSVFATEESGWTSSL